MQERERVEREAREEERRQREREDLLASMTPQQRQVFLQAEQRCDERWSLAVALIGIAGFFLFLSWITPKTALSPGSVGFFAAGTCLVLYAMTREEPRDHRWKRRAGYVLLVVATLTATGVLVWFPKTATPAELASSVSQALLTLSMSKTIFKTASETVASWQATSGDAHV